jgi:hypothetical protein
MKRVKIGYHEIQQPDFFDLWFYTYILHYFCPYSQIIKISHVELYFVLLLVDLVLDIYTKYSTWVKMLNHIMNLIQLCFLNI